MADVWKSIAELTATMHPDRIASIADAISQLKSFDDFDESRTAFGPNVDAEFIDNFRAAWTAAPKITSAEIAAAFNATARVLKLADSRGSIELVWTGPKTGMIPTRRTEQVLLEVIDAAHADLFLVTYSFYKASSIVDTLNAAVTRGVGVRILLESSKEHGGTLKGDSVKVMRESVTGASVYVWSAEKRSAGGAASAAVHAKCAVADDALAFITSANLTSSAMERNMELGTLIRGGSVPGKLRQHLDALVTTQMITICK